MRAPIRLLRFVLLLVSAYVFLLGCALAYPLAIESARVTPTATTSATKSVVMLRRDGDITILSNGDVRMRETWQVQFIGGPFTFAYRSISLDGVREVDNWEIVEGDQVYRLNDNKAANTFLVTKAQNERRIEWYFPPTTNTEHTFSLGYTLHDVLKIGKGTREFYWTFIESDRAYPIQATRVRLHLPAAFAPNQITAMTYQDAAEQNGAQVIDGQTVEFVGGPISPGSEWEIRVQYPNQ